MLIDGTDVLRCVVVCVLYSTSCAICAFVRSFVFPVSTVSTLVVRARTVATLLRRAATLFYMPEALTIKAF
jgi:hypothetical protein